MVQTPHLRESGPPTRRSDHAAAVALDPERLLLRTFEVVPGLLTWVTLLGLGVLGFIVPAAVAIFLILYDLYWLIRAFYMSVYLLASYRLLRRHRGIDWPRRLKLVVRPSAARQEIRARVAALATTLHAGVFGSARERQRAKIALWQEREFLRDLERLTSARIEVLPWEQVLHVVIIPTYREPFPVLVTSLDSLRNVAYPKERVWVVVAFEERAGEEAQRIREQIEREYGSAFGRFLTTVHPDGLPGEQRVKSANATWAARRVQSLLDEECISYDHVVVSNFDSDTCVDAAYFFFLTYVYITSNNRTRASYQPLPLYNNNIWDAPAFTRVIATSSSFWQMIEAVRPERLVTFSSHAMSFRALVDAGFWDVNVVSEDSRIFWQCFLRYGGQYRTLPLFTNVSMDATNAPTLWRTFKNQYKQNRRWAWGIENFPYVANALRRHPEISFPRRIRILFRLLEGHHSWATSAIIIAVLGWIPILFGGAEFHQTILAYNLPFVTRTLMTLAMCGLVVTMALTLLLLPPPPPRTSKWKYVSMVLQWALVPVIASVLGSAPAIDAQTRLMIGRPLGFWITEKSRANGLQRGSARS